MVRKSFLGRVSWSLELQQPENAVMAIMPTIKFLFGNDSFTKQLPAIEFKVIQRNSWKS